MFLEATEAAERAQHSPCLHGLRSRRQSQALWGPQAWGTGLEDGLSTLRSGSRTACPAGWGPLAHLVSRPLEGDP